MSISSSEISIEICERQLDRIQSFHPRIDAKVTALFAISAGQLAIAISNLKPDDLKIFWIHFPLQCFMAFVLYVFVQLYRCSFPRLEGGEGSLVYFAEVAKLSSDVYNARYGALTENELKQDLTCQIWRNSEIVAMKYARLKSATIGAMLSIIPWIIFLAATALHHWEVPKV